MEPRPRAGLWNLVQPSVRAWQTDVEGFRMGNIRSESRHVGDRSGSTGIFKGDNFSKTAASHCTSAVPRGPFLNFKENSSQHRPRSKGEGGPGLLGRVLCKVFFHPDERVAPVSIDQPLTAGEILPVAGGIEVIHVPGHCAGQVVLLWRPGRMLFAADVCLNVMGLGDPVGFENLDEGRASQRKVANLSFDAVGFGHGKPIAHDASMRFRNRYGRPEDVHQQRSAG